MLKYVLTFLLMGSIAQAQDTIVSTYSEPGAFVITVRETPDGVTFLRYEGEFVESTSLALATAIQITPEAAFVELNSLGGLFYTDDPASEEILARGLPVVVKAGEICASACAYTAMASPDIRIDGLLAFHLPYNGAFAKEATLYDISQSSVEMTLLMAKRMFEQGWRLVLYYNIEQNTGLDTWMVFDDSQELNRYRFTDPATFMDATEVPPSFFIGSTEEVTRMSAAQVVDGNP